MYVRATFFFKLSTSASMNAGQAVTISAAFRKLWKASEVVHEHGIRVYCFLLDENSSFHTSHTSIFKMHRQMQFSHLAAIYSLCTRTHSLGEVAPGRTA